MDKHKLSPAAQPAKSHHNNYDYLIEMYTDETKDRKLSEYVSAMMGTIPKHEVPPGAKPQRARTPKFIYNVTFDMFSKISVKGDDQHPLYHYLTKESPVPGEVKWNFQKYLVDRKGNVVDKFTPGTEPTDKDVIAEIEKLLNEQ